MSKAGNRLNAAALGLGLFLGLIQGPSAAGGAETGFFNSIAGDYVEFYSVPNMLELGGGIAVGGVIANTSIDEDVRDWYQEDVRSSGSDDVAKMAKVFGNGFITVPVFAGASLLSVWSGESDVCGTVGRWGELSLRSILVGAPPVLVLQQVLGSGRPSDGVDSKWRPFEDDNGVSGHAFIGAVPFMVAAGMSDNLAAKSVLYIGSTLGGLSRINDDDHYLSQVLIGWWVAYLATDVVDRPAAPGEHSGVGPFFDGEHCGLAYRRHF